MDHVLVVGLGDARGGQGIALLVLADEVPAEVDDDEDEEAVAAQVRGEGRVVRGGLDAQEHLRADRVADRPEDEVGRHHHRLLGLPAHVPRHHRQPQRLRRPERQRDVVADQEPDVLREGLVRDRHEEDRADEGSVAPERVSCLVVN